LRGKDTKKERKKERRKERKIKKKLRKKERKKDKIKKDRKKERKKEKEKTVWTNIPLNGRSYKSEVSGSTPLGGDFSPLRGVPPR